MKIEAIELFHVRMPLREPWRTAYGSDAAIESVLVRMQSNGAVGWGEASPLAQPCYSPEYAAGVFATARDIFAPRLLGESIASGAALQDRLAIYKGNPFAKSALDTAWWDLHAQTLGIPLYRALGGTQPTVSAGADFGIRDSVEELLELVGGALESGAPRIKLKFGPGWELPVVQKVRECFPDATIHIDCNSGYRLEDEALFREIDTLGLAMIEQPLRYDDIADHAVLQSRLNTPICLDESINSLERAAQAIRLKACGLINIKPGRVGGLTVALQIRALCEAAGIGCWVGGMLESAVGAMECAALATLPGFTYPADLFPSSRFYATDLSAPEVAFAKPWSVTLSEAPGAGASPDPDRLKRWTVSHAAL